MYRSVYSILTVVACTFKLTGQRSEASGRRLVSHATFKPSKRLLPKLLIILFYWNYWNSTRIRNKQLSLLLSHQAVLEVLQLPQWTDYGLPPVFSISWYKYRILRCIWNRNWKLKGQYPIQIYGKWLCWGRTWLVFSAIGFVANILRLWVLISKK